MSLRVTNEQIKTIFHKDSYEIEYIYIYEMCIYIWSFLQEPFTLVLLF